MLSKKDVPRFVDLYEKMEEEFRPVLWEIPFTEFAKTTVLHPWQVTEKGCFEIDTQEDYSQALKKFESESNHYQL